MVMDFDIIAACGGFVMGIIWMVRLEAKVLYLEKANASHWEKIDEMKNKLDQISESLARLEGKLETRG